MAGISRVEPARPAGSAEIAWHALNREASLQQLNVAAAHGLGPRQVAQSLAQHGPNALLQAPPPAPWLRLAQQLASSLVHILLAAAVLSLALGHLGDAGVILVIVLANATIGLLQEGRAERSMAALRQLTEVQVRVARDGREAMPRPAAVA